MNFQTNRLPSGGERGDREANGPGLGLTMRRYYWALATICAIAFSIRLALVIGFIGLNSPPDAAAGYDQVDYELFAFHMSEGLGYTNEQGEATACRMPGTSLTILPVYYVCGRNYGAVRVWFCVLGALTCCAVAWVGTLMFGRPTGLVAALLLALYPNHAYFALHFVSETPFALLVILAAGVTVQAMRSGSVTWWSLAAGGLWGASALIRPNIILVFPLLWLVALFAKEMRVVQLGRAAIISVLAISMLVPWVARNHVVMGKAMLTPIGAYTFWGAHNHKTLQDAPGGWIRTIELVDDQHPLEGNEVERMEQAWHYGMEFVREHRATLPYLSAMKVGRFLSPFEETANRAIYWSFALAWIVALPLLIIGIAQALRERARECHLLLLPFWATIATALIFYGCIRFRDSLAPLYLVFSAVGVLAVARHLSRAFKTRTAQLQRSIEAGDCVSSGGRVAG